MQEAIDKIQKAIEEIRHNGEHHAEFVRSNGELVISGLEMALEILQNLLSAQPERLTDDDFETIRIHLNAYKEKLCNQHRWKEAEEYRCIIDRFMAFASAQQERKTGEWNFIGDNMFECSCCGVAYTTMQLNSLRNYDTDPYAPKFCPNCGADMGGKQNE